MESLKVSIIIPTRNEESTIERCLKSVFDQTYRNFEVIIVDSSTDKTPQLAAKYNVKLVCLKAKGVGAAFKEGIKHASGDIISKIDADDFVAIDYLEKNLKPFLEPNVMGVHPIWVFIKPKKIIGKVLYCYRQIFLIKSKFSHWPQLWRRKIFDYVQIDETLRVGEDADFWRRVKKIADNKNWEFRYGTGCNYFSDIEDTLVKNFKKSVWYGSGLVKFWRKNVDHLVNIIPIIFFSCTPLAVIAYLLTYNNIFLLWILLYLGSWFFVMLKALRKHYLTLYVLFIPPLLIWRALGHLTGIFLSFLSHKAEK